MSEESKNETIPVPTDKDIDAADSGAGGVVTNNHKKEEEPIDEPDAKKTKMSIEQAPDSAWPEAWVMADNVTEQCQDNKQEPNVAVDAEGLRKIGISYWQMDADSYEYPIKAVPWDPKDAMDPKLKALRDDRGYSYADIITIHPDHLPDFDKKIQSFFEEHIHDAEEIRYILDGSGYFDCRNFDDKWVRIHVKKGDLITLPEGIYHRKLPLVLSGIRCVCAFSPTSHFLYHYFSTGFTCDEGRLCKAMRLFIGQPVWTPFNRPADEHPSRQKYVKDFVEEKKSSE